MKSIIYLVVGLFILSGFTTVGIGEASQKQGDLRFTFSEPTIIEKESFVQLRSEGTDSWVFDAGSPMVPRRIETLALPFGTTVQSVVCSAQGVQTKVLTQKVEPAPQPMILGSDPQVSSPQMNAAIYDSNDLFPSDWVSYNVGAGLDENNQHVTFLTINTYPVRYQPASDTIYCADDIQVTVTYKSPDKTPFPANTEYKLVIIAPSKFSSALQPLVDHKISKGISTMLKTTEDIYAEFTTGYDKPEQIKLFIKSALENYNTTYVLLVGGLNSWWNAVARDNKNEGTQDWYVPVRYSNCMPSAGDDPGFISDLYYADIYNDTGVFCSWDSNGNHIYGQNADKKDTYPDVALGRLPCRNIKEVKAVVDKIIHYETTPVDDWFNKMVGVSGDGFMDILTPIGIYWNTNSLPNGEYTICAQSKNINNVYGPVDEIKVTLDKSKATSITFNHDDHLITKLKYPFPPVAEIVSVSDGDILGNTDYSYVPTEHEAYCNDFSGWANIQYSSGTLKINGKAYDPRPYGVDTSIHVWVNNSAGTTVFTQTKTGYGMYWEGEWCVGDQLLLGRAGGGYYMPSSIEKNYLFTSSGAWTNMKQVLAAFNEGAGFFFFSGHGNPGVWVDQYPGIPGNRKNAEVEGLVWLQYKALPFFPMDSLKNEYMNPVVAVGGCHNSQFNVSFLPTLKDRTNAAQLQCYGYPVAECWSERLVRLEKTGAIASMGNTGFGYGLLGEYCTTGGLDGYITTEFFVQYGTNGHHGLGEAYAATLTEYINHFKASIESPWDFSHQKSVEQWVLIGDPSLMIGGYS
ncbi:MAG TPA: peptidase C25 [Thermoplasmata archaeon]|nr:peptidase C25 [Thermoplasmata archaeon]